MERGSELAMWGSNLIAEITPCPLPQLLRAKPSSYFLFYVPTCLPCLYRFVTCLVIRLWHALLASCRIYLDSTWVLFPYLPFLCPLTPLCSRALIHPCYSTCCQQHQRRSLGEFSPGPGMGCQLHNKTKPNTAVECCEVWAPALYAEFVETERCCSQLAI